MGLREDVERAGVRLPNETEQKAISQMFNERMDKILPPDKVKTWFNLFKDFDEDQSGLITFEELASGVRDRLRITRAELSDIKLKALWVVMDADDSGFLEKSEFHKFMDREESIQEKAALRASMAKAKTRGVRQELEQRQERELQLEGFKSAYKTSTMRQELEDAGVPLADEVQKRELAIEFAKWVKAYKPHSRQGIAFLEVFKEVDNDNSGLVTFDQVRHVVRHVFKLKKADCSEHKIKLIWCALDTDDSNTIQQVEFVRFMRLAGVHKDDSSTKAFTFIDRAPTRETIAPTPQKEQVTAPTREDIEAAGGQLPTLAEQQTLSKLFNERMDKILPPDKAKTWFNLFKDFDEDQSGLITFDELLSGVRERLRITKAELSDLKLKALWAVMDADESGILESGEFQRFMRREDSIQEKAEKRAELKRLQSEKMRKEQEAHHERELQLDRLKSEYKTGEMRKELEAAGVPPLDEDTKTKLAIDFAKWVKAYKPDTHPGIAWLQVFREVDNDHSGILTFEELRHVVRRLFKLTKSECSERTLKLIWCALDSDDSDTIAQVEFGRFMRLAGVHKESGGSKGFTFIDRAPTREHDEVEKVILENPTREEVEAAGGRIPSAEELNTLSKLFNERMDRILPPDKAKTWFNMFKDFDEDQSGLITFDEMSSGVRERLRIKKAELSDLKLKALWVALDADDSGFVESGEFHRFMNKEETPQDKAALRAQKQAEKNRRLREELEAQRLRELELDGYKSMYKTAVMRRELEEAGVPMADDERKVTLAKEFFSWVKAYKPDADQAIAWLQVFKEVDNDHSGILTFEELRHVVRRLFKLKKSECSEEKLKVIWCALDTDSSDTIQQVEFGRFIKLANAKRPSAPDANQLTPRAHVAGRE